MAVKPPVAEIRNVSKFFSGVQVLHNVSLAFSKGEVHALVGENGAGKTTLMNILYGVYQPDAGEVWWKGSKVRIGNPLEAQRLGIGMIHQERALLPHMTVAENICMGRLPSRGGGLVDFRKINQEASRVLKLLGITYIAPTVLVRSLTPSERQLVEIAKVLAGEPELIIMDEPTASLTVEESQRLLEVVRGLCEKGVAIIYISHRMDEVFKIADVISVLRDGHVVCSSKRGELTPEEVITFMVGRELKTRDIGRAVIEQRQGRYGSDEIVLSVKNLSKRGKFSNVSFELRKSEILGFAGLVGAGRSEVMEAIFGYDPPDSGEIYFKGTRVKFSRPVEAVKCGIGMVPEDRKGMALFSEQSVQDNITIVNLKGLRKRFLLDRRQEKACAEQFVSYLRIKLRNVRQKVRYLSGGNQQKVVLARWLAIKPEILILDEPTHGVDIGAKLEIYQLISELAAKGTSILLVSSELPELLRLCDRIVVMYKGRCMATLSRQEATEEVIMTYATNQRSVKEYNK
ncbi:MAG: sugar ABC transporter ATP-binding protein [Thermoanaerobacteraceae bacterium]|nr:sugar ABC transporter ATP-binding protein [Thermoanaerobacteraceae bacterium]